LISNPKDKHGFGQLKERQFYGPCHKRNPFMNISPAIVPVLNRQNYGASMKRPCAAEAIFCCPTENSHHLEAQVLSKNALFHNEKEPKKIRPDVK
jgi:hypothetical protein